MMQELSHNPHIMHAYTFDQQGNAKATDEAALDALKPGQWSWVHLDADNPETKPWLEKELSAVDGIILDALLAEETRPRMTRIDDAALIILGGIQVSDESCEDEMIFVRLWIEEHRVISVHKQELLAVSDVEKMIGLGKGPKSPGALISMLAGHLFDRMEPKLTEFDELTDDIEEKVLDAPDTDLRGDIVDIRRKAIMLHRYMLPQRDALNQLIMANFYWIDKVNQRHLQEVYNHALRYVEDLEAIRERAQVVKDELVNMLSDRLNRNMYVLSVMAAIFLPLGFLTGLLGVNIGGIPGTSDESAFWLFNGLLVGIIVIQILVFKRFKWF